MALTSITYEDFTRANGRDCWHYEVDGITIAVSGHRTYSDADGSKHGYRAWYAHDDVGSGTEYGVTFDEAVSATVARIQAGSA